MSVARRHENNIVEGWTELVALSVSSGIEETLCCFDLWQGVLRRYLVIVLRWWRCREDELQDKFLVYVNSDVGMFYS